MCTLMMAALRPWIGFQRRACLHILRTCQEATLPARRPLRQELTSSCAVRHAAEEGLLTHRRPSLHVLVLAGKVLLPHPCLELGARTLDAPVCVAVADDLVTVHQPHAHADVDLIAWLEPT
eukprot:GHRQ01018778.1.p2 GENE.GHRQ01018778.1~~GHRQ01018778.1.p2  ORF type:complete len:121 (+),score=3.72 GHRQ01018778.1:1244-1606(+)